MKDQFFKYVPLVFGAVFGVALMMLALSPAALFGLSWPVRVLIGIPAMTLMFLLFTVFMISSALPAGVRMTPIDQSFAPRG